MDNFTMKKLEENEDSALIRKVNQIIKTDLAKRYTDGTNGFPWQLLVLLTQE
jgi:hypothetical protein